MQTPCIVFSWSALRVPDLVRLQNIFPEMLSRRLFACSLQKLPPSTRWLDWTAHGGRQYMTGYSVKRINRAQCSSQSIGVNCQSKGPSLFHDDVDDHETSSSNRPQDRPQQHAATAPTATAAMASKLTPFLMRTAVRPACRVSRPQQTRAFSVAAQRRSDTLMVVRISITFAPPFSIHS